MAANQTSMSQMADYFLKGVSYFRDPIIIISVIFSWMIFSVLNRPVGELDDSFSDATWYISIGVSIALSVLTLLVILRYFKI